ncbi:hypothetical protein AAFJ72_02200 [Brevibacillus gelatini]|uniref:hypothetical protein n=1 Tax=Brevibacillus gelatini TaxID=1655277 RepID=UPI003D819FBD
MEKLDLTELHQYFNDLSLSIRETGDKTSSSLLAVQGELGSLNATLHTTNYLLIGILIMNAILLFLVLFKNNRK